MDLMSKPPEWWAKELNEPLEKMTPEYIEHLIDESYKRANLGKMWKNEIYTVQVTEEENGITELSIRRNDRQPVTDWRHKQEMKNQLCGPEREGLEIYPAESRKVDTSNQYYIFVLPEGQTIPLGFSNRLVSEDTIGRSQQRKFDE